MSSSSSGGKKGGNWEHKIYFDPESDKTSGHLYNIKDDELDTVLTGLLDAGEKITMVYAYKVPLFKWQLTSALLFHMFIVFKTDGWYWSIEKHSDGITIQRSKQLSAVKDRYRQGDRKLNGTITIMSEDRGVRSIRELIDWLWKKNELNQPYNYLTNNCQHFANRVFNYVSISGGEHNIYFDPESDKTSGHSYNIDENELVAVLTGLRDAGEQITMVYAYTFPLFTWRQTSALDFHMFIVFETDGWYWSIEKHSDGVTIQRSKQLSAVKDRYRQDDRKVNGTITIMSEDRGVRSIRELIDWLWEKNELNQPYNYLTNNCQHFAKRVFNYVSRRVKI